MFADFFDAFGLRTVFTHLLVFEQFAQLPSCVKAVELLAAAFLDLHGQARWEMFEMDAGGGLIDVLTARSAAADKGLLDIGLPQAARLHPPGEFFALSFCNTKVNHRGFPTV